MTDSIMPLADRFPVADDDAWMAAVDKVLEGRSFDKVLRTDLGDGIVTEPLYSGDVDSHSAMLRPVRTEQAWDIRQRHGLTTPAETNRAIRRDLERGVSSIELLTGGITDRDTMAAVLDGVLLDLAPVALLDPGNGVGAARLFMEVAVDTAPEALLGHLGCDPIGRLADHGTAGAPIADAIAETASFAVELAPLHPLLRTLRADSAPFGQAGATPATELAALLSTAVTYVRALVEADLSADAAFDQVLLATTVGTDQFLDIAKLRALRIMWRRVAEASGVSDAEPLIQAGTSLSVLTRHDPWVNMLRTTTGCLAAAVGGADIILVRSFDVLLGIPDDLGLRIARNTQLVLMEESNVHRVADPAGGSWYIDRLTDQIAEQAWSQFQQIEQAGGVTAELQSGALQAQIADAWERQHRAVATRRRAVTGVSEFADLAEVAVVRPAPPMFDRAHGEPEIEPLRPRRLAEDFERLRLAAAALDPAPSVFSANLGAPAEHTARSSWAANLFAAGGIATTHNEGFADDASLAAAFTASGCRAAVIAGTDGQYAERAGATAAALRTAGADVIYLAGNPGDARSTYQEAGVDHFIHVGCDTLDVLETLLRTLGADLDGSAP